MPASTYTLHPSVSLCAECRTPVLSFTFILYPFAFYLITLKNFNKHPKFFNGFRPIDPAEQKNLPYQSEFLSLPCQMPIIVIVGRMHCAKPRAEFESAEFTPDTALEKSQTLSVKEAKIGICGRIRPYLHEKAQRLQGDLKTANVA